MTRRFSVNEYKDKTVKLALRSTVGDAPVTLAVDDILINAGEAPAVSKFVVNGIQYTVNESDRTKVAVTGYPSDDVNAVIPADVTYQEVTYTVTEIGESAFDYMPDLASVTLPNTIERIGSMAFWGDSGLTSVTIPESVKVIDEGAFLYCQNLATVNFSEGLETLGISAFSNCGILNLELPGTVTSIGNYAFSTCIMMKTAVLPEGITSIPYSMFDECTSLTDVNIPSTVNYIGAFAFRNTAITAAVVPEGVTDINNSTFKSCKSLKSIDLPSTLKTIGTEAFYECTALEEGTFRSLVPPVPEIDSFDLMAVGARGYCPAESLSTYMAYEPLNYFDFAPITGVDIIESIDAGEVRYFDLNGIEVVNPGKGETVVRVARSAAGKLTVSKVVM